MSRQEVLTRGEGPFADELVPGVHIRVLAARPLGAQGLATALARFQPGARLPYHTHPCSEAVVVLEGRVGFLVEGRLYRLEPFDALHVPAGTAHSVLNLAPDGPALLHSSFASDTPARELVADTFPQQEREKPGPGSPETVLRFRTADVYELSPGAFFRDLFARRFGARGICGGYGLFEPGASLPCHYHGFDESITIVSGEGVCQVAGREYNVSNYDTACIPRGRPHRFLNRSERPMAMVWVYAGDEPDRVLVDPGYCEGRLDPAALPGLTESNA